MSRLRRGLYNKEREGRTEDTLHVLAGGPASGEEEIRKTRGEGAWSPMLQFGFVYAGVTYPGESEPVTRRALRFRQRGHWGVGSERTKGGHEMGKNTG